MGGTFLHDGPEAGGTRVLVATSVHPLHDARIVRQIEALVAAGCRCTLFAPWHGSPAPAGCATIYFKPRSGLTGRVATYLHFLRTAWRTHWKVLHFHDFDLIPAALLVRLTSVGKIIYDVHENYAEEVAIRANIPNVIRRPLQFLVNLLEWIAAHLFTALIVVVQAQEERFRTWGCSQVVMVRNFASRSMVPSGYQPDPVIEQGRYVLNTAGQTVDNGADLLLEAATLLFERDPSIPVKAIDHFTPGFRHAFIQKAEQAVANYELLPRIQPSALHTYLRTAAIGLSVIRDVPNKRIGIPTKLFEYMAFGIPVIATDVGYQSEIIKDSGAGILIPPDDPQALASAIIELWYDREKRVQLGNAGIKAFQSRYSWEVESAQLTGLYAQL